MSFHFLDRSFPLKQRAASDTELAQIVSAALHEDFGETSSWIKQIGRLTGANPRAIKNWSEARNAPSSGHLLLLARSSPTLLRFILEQIGGEDLRDAFLLLKGRIKIDDAKQKLNESSEIYSDKLVTIKVSINPEETDNMNERQLWFLGAVQYGHKPKAEDIAKTWRVTPRTAKRDLAGLLEKGLIIFTGAKKTGWYEII